MRIVLLVILAAWLLWKLSPWLLALFEKEHVRGDIEPRPYSPDGWKSAYLDAKVAEAAAQGLMPCGSYFTAKQKSLVKGPMLLYQTPDGRAAVALISARFGSTELKKVEVVTRFSDGTAIVTSDGFLLPDYTGFIEKKTLYEAPLAELIESHLRRVEESCRAPDLITQETAFSMYERVEFERGERMVRAGCARWTDPAQTTLRRTFKGVFTTVRANKQEQRRVIADEITRREEQEKGAPADPGPSPDLTPVQDALLAAALAEYNARNEALLRDWGFAGSTQWGFDQKTGLFFVQLKDGSRVEATGQIYGSYSEDAGTWEWAWNNPHVMESVKQDARRVKAYGERESLGCLTSGIVPAPKLDGSMSASLAAIAMKVCGAQGVYAGQGGQVKVYIGLKNLAKVT